MNTVLYTVFMRAWFFLVLLLLFLIINYVPRSCGRVHGSYARRPHGDGCTWYSDHNPGCRLTGPPLPGPLSPDAPDTVQFLPGPGLSWRRRRFPPHISTFTPKFFKNTPGPHGRFRRFPLPEKDRIFLSSVSYTLNSSVWPKCWNTCPFSYVTAIFITISSWFVITAASAAPAFFAVLPAAVSSVRTQLVVASPDFQPFSIDQTVRQLFPG